MRISGCYKDINPICALQQLCSDTYVLQLFALVYLGGIYSENDTFRASTITSHILFCSAFVFYSIQAIFNNLMTLRMQSAPPSLMASFHTRYPIITDHYTLGQCCDGAFECDKYLQVFTLSFASRELKLLVLG